MNPSESTTEVLARYAATREAQTGRPVATNRDVLDLLVALRGEDAFWNDLGASLPVDECPLDVSQLRAALPGGSFQAELSVEDCLASIGLDRDDITAILDDEPARAAVTQRIAAAFAAGSPQQIACALESLLTESPAAPVLARLRDRHSVARGLATVFTVASLAGMAFGSLTACYKGVTPEV